MLQMNVLKFFQSHRVLIATYHFNRLPSRVLNFKSHFDVLQLDLSHLKVFGCIFFMHLPTTHRDKLDSRAIKCIFPGYSQTQKEYKCYNYVSKRLYVSTNIQFVKDTLYFSALNQREILLELFPLPSIDTTHQYANPIFFIISLLTLFLTHLEIQLQHHYPALFT